MRKIYLLLLALMTGCTTYSERFTYWGPDGTNHTVKVTHRTFLIWGRAAQLETETQTMEFIRTVNATGLEFKPDSETIKAAAEGLGYGIGKALVPKP